MTKGQAERLLPLLEEMLAEAGLRWADLTRIGVGIGPGNFTGTRISVAAARGLALSLRIPAIGVSALEAASHALPRPVWSVLDARRDEVYLQQFAPDPAPPRLIAVAALADELPQGAVLTGSAAEAASGLCAGQVLQPAMPVAEAIARIAAARTPDGSRPAPLYLRAADAALPSDRPPALLPG